MKVISRRKLLVVGASSAACTVLPSGASAAAADGVFGYALGLKFAGKDRLEQVESAPPQDYRGYPASYDLRRWAPPIGDQGYQGSCVGWSTAYGAMTTMIRARGEPAQVPFSPSFVYNRGMLMDATAIGDWPHCSAGMMIETALSLIEGFGLLPKEEFEYQQDSCKKFPDWYDDRQATKRLINGWSLAPSDDSIKHSIWKGTPAIVGMKVGRAFMNYNSGPLGKLVFDKKETVTLGGHAMAIVAYDNIRKAWLLMNSWKDTWGGMSKGYCWISYDALSHASSVEGIKRVFLVEPA